MERLVERALLAAAALAGVLLLVLLPLRMARVQARPCRFGSLAAQADEVVALPPAIDVALAQGEVEVPVGWHALAREGRFALLARDPAAAGTSPP